MQHNRHTQRPHQPNTHLPAPSLQARVQAFAWRTAARIVLPLFVMGLRKSERPPQRNTVTDQGHGRRL